VHSDKKLKIDPELVHFRVTNGGDPLGVMHAKEKSAQKTLRVTE